MAEWLNMAEKLGGLGRKSMTTLNLLKLVELSSLGMNFLRDMIGYWLDNPLPLFQNIRGATAQYVLEALLDHGRHEILLFPTRKFAF